MAALQHPVGGLPLDGSTSRKSFAEVLAAKTIASAAPSDPYEHDPLKLGLHKGQPAAFFTDLQLQGLSGAYAWSLVGKFSQGYNKDNPKKGRPSLDSLHQYFLSLDLRSDFSLGLLDNRHVLIHLSHEEDYLRLYSRMVWYVGAVTMRVFRWSPYFRVDKESPLVPVWIKLPRLPIMLFEKRTLFSLASLVGRPMRCDAATEALKRPSVARIQVEIDLLKPKLDQIWIGLGEHDGYWQAIEYEFIPDYCPRCWHVGHSETTCHANNPEFKHSDAVQPMQHANPRPKLKQKFVAKGTLASTSAQSGDPVVETISLSVKAKELPPAAPPITVHEAGPSLPSAETVAPTNTDHEPCLSLPSVETAAPTTAVHEPGPSFPSAATAAPTIHVHEVSPSLPPTETLQVLPHETQSNLQPAEETPESDDELQIIDPAPEPDSFLLDKIPLAADKVTQVSGIQDDFQLGASDKLYPPSVLGTRSVRSLPHSARPMDLIISELRDFRVGFQLHKSSDHPPQKRGRPPKSQNKSLPPPMAHGMATRSQNSASHSIINE